MEEEATDHNCAVNDLSESSFAGVTAQNQCHRRIGMHSAAAVSNISINDFLTWPTTKKISTHSCVNVCLVFFQQLRAINVCHFLHFP